MNRCQVKAMAWTTVSEDLQNGIRATSTGLYEHLYYWWYTVMFLVHLMLSHSAYRAQIVFCYIQYTFLSSRNLHLKLDTYYARKHLSQTCWSLYECKIFWQNQLGLKTWHKLDTKRNYFFWTPSNVLLMFSWQQLNS